MLKSFWNTPVLTTFVLKSSGKSSEIFGSCWDVFRKYMPIKTRQKISHICPKTLVCVNEWASEGQPTEPFSSDGWHSTVKRLTLGFGFQKVNSCYWWILSFLSAFQAISHLKKTLLFIAQFIIGYFLMLVAMTYNVWLFLAVVGGSGIGYFLVRPYMEYYLEQCSERSHPIYYIDRDFTAYSSASTL